MTFKVILWKSRADGSKDGSEYRFESFFEMVDLLNVSFAGKHCDEASIEVV